MKKNAEDDRCATGCETAVVLESASDAAERVEALAHAAKQALADLPFLRGDAEQRAVGRLFRLVEATADAAALALDVIEAALEGLKGTTPTDRR